MSLITMTHRKDPLDSTAVGQPTRSQMRSIPVCAQTKMLGARKAPVPPVDQTILAAVDLLEDFKESSQLTFPLEVLDDPRINFLNETIFEVVHSGPQAVPLVSSVVGFFTKYGTARISEDGNQFQSTTRELFFTDDIVKMCIGHDPPASSSTEEQTHVCSVVFCACTCVICAVEEYIIGHPPVREE